MNPNLPLPPLPTVDSEGFWAATADGRLAISWCKACQRYQHPPMENCRQCAGPLEFRPVSGDGMIFSYIVVHRCVAPGYLDRPGHVIALVELDEQPNLRLPTQLIDITAEDIRIGMPVRAELVELPGADVKVPRFRPLDPAEARTATPVRE